MPLSRQQMRDAFKKVPESVRDTVSSPEFGDTIESLGTKYRLHIDTVGFLSDAATRMLLGLLAPTQFVAELKTAGIEDAAANAILQDLNEKVFKPLHEKVRAEKGIAPEPAQASALQTSPVPQAPVQSPVQVPPVPASAPTSVPPPAPVPAPVPVPPPAPVIPTPEPAPFVPPPPPPAPVVTPESSAHPQMRTMAHDIEEMKDGKVPPSFMNLSPAPVPQAQVAARPAAPVAPPPPREAPSATPTQAEVHESLKQYGIDPYREPVE